MILIKEKLGNIFSSSIHNCYVDTLLIEWHEKRKRILHKQTKNGVHISLKFLQENPELKEGDILYKYDNNIIAVEINTCECIVIAAKDAFIASGVCYEIGNRHLPLFYEGDDLLVPFDVPLFATLESCGYVIKVEERKLNNSFKTTVTPHFRIGETVSLSNTSQPATNSL